MTRTPQLTVTRVETGWHVTRPDGYYLVYAQPDYSRPGTWKAETTAFAQEQRLTTATIDVLNLRDREAFHVAASSVNGKTPIMWDQFLQDGYLAIQDAIEQETEGVNSQLDATGFSVS